MSMSKKVFLLCLSLFGIIIVPYIGAYLHTGGNFNQHYFDFPPLKPEEVFNNFSWSVFWTVAAIFALTVLLYLFPTLFGWKRVDKSVAIPVAPAVDFPVWFWTGLIIWIGTLIFLAGHFSSPKWLLNWAYVPLYWSFTFMLDGVVYKRTGGKSMFSDAPQELIAIGVSSVAGWLIFEYLNFFVLEYWYYPKGGLLKDDIFCTYAIFASSALLPLCFEWYSFFNSFPRFVKKYQRGPSISFSTYFQTILIILAYVALFMMSFYPTYLCPVIWLSPLIIITITLDLLDIWTPFTPIKNGNWTPVLFMALTYLLEGFLLEGQNYLSGSHANGGIQTDYPGYWVYNVPFVNRFHIFEMPVVGFYGYLPFGIYCLVWWISFAFLLRIPTDFAKFDSPVY